MNAESGTQRTKKTGLLTDNKNDEKNKMMLIRVLFCR